MKSQRNMRVWDRCIRYIGGVALLTWAFAGGPLWAFAAIFPIATAAWGFCPFYSFFRSS